MEQGWIKLHRDLINWEWYDDMKTKVLFLHLILICNHVDKKWRGINVLAGQKITSYGHLSIQTGLSIQNIRTSISKLKSTGELTYESTSEYSLLTINNYNKYQTANKQVTSDQQAANKQVTTNKNDKNEKNEKNTYINITKSFFKDKNIQEQIKEKLIEKYNSDPVLISVELEKFILYWTEPNRTGTKQRWEMQKTFEVMRRLYTWFQNNKERTKIKTKKRYNL